MAWWLEPEKQQQPLNAPPRPQGGPWDLPTGVSRIIAVDPQNALLVYATAEGAARLAEAIHSLDRPLRQVEVEAQFVQVVPEAMAKAGIPDATKGFFRGNFAAALNTLMEAKKAKVISAPRNITFDNTATAIKAEYGAPAIMDLNRSRNLLDSPTQKTVENFVKSGSLTVFNSRTWLITPKINADDTVTLSADGYQKLELRGAPKTDEAIVIKQSEPISVTANLRDGETILIPYTPITEQADKGLSKSFVLITARLVRRAGEQLPDA